MSSPSDHEPFIGDEAVGGRGYVVLHEVRLYPSAPQKVLLADQGGHARYLWNLGLEQRLMCAGRSAATRSRS